jgi:hypothetical protein
VIVTERLKIARGHTAMSSALRFILFAIDVLIGFISAMTLILYK